jgi:hypothetical protein
VVAVRNPIRCAGSAEPIRHLQRIFDGSTARSVIENAPCLRAARQCEQTSRPTLDLGECVDRPIRTRGSVQTVIHRRLSWAQPSAGFRSHVETGGVGSHASDVVLYKQIIRPRNEPAGMPRFAHDRACIKLANQVEKSPSNPRVEFQGGWKLDQQRSELAAKAGDFRQKLFERLTRPSEPGVMCNRPIHLNRKAKASWRRTGPFRIGLGRVRAGKRRVDFRAPQHFGIAGQMTSRLREFASRGPRQGPSRSADDDHFVVRPESNPAI